MKSVRKLPDSLDVLPSPDVNLVLLAKPKAKRKLTTTEKLVVNGVKYSLNRDPRSKVWYVRKRTKDANICHNLGVVDLAVAKDKAREFLGEKDNLKTRLKTGSATLREVCDAYLAMPKRAADTTANENVGRLERIVEVAWGRTLEDVKASELSPRLWEDYAAKRQGGKLDLSTRQHVNRGINSALRMAISIFHEGLHEGYKRAGIKIDFDEATKVQWLPEIPARLAVLAKENEAAFEAALPALKAANRPMWRAVMIARYAGLRAKEIRFACKSWLSHNPVSGGLQFEIRDRPEDQYWHKTGEDYVAPVLSVELEEDLAACPDGPLVPVDGSRDNFFSHLCNRWLRQYIPRPNKGLHRLRALYLEHLKNITVMAVRAEQAGIEAARSAAGHTTSKTTTTHYLPAPTSPL